MRFEGGTPKTMKRNKHTKTLVFFFGVTLFGTLLGRGIDGFMATKSVAKGETIRGDMEESAILVADIVPESERVKLPPTDIKGYIRYVFGKHTDEALAVAYCESRFHANSVGGVGERGLFQIHPIHTKRIEKLGLKFDDMFNPYRNTDVAYNIFKEQGWGPWTCKFVLKGGELN